MRKPNPSIAIAGSSGFLGQALAKALTLHGAEVKRLIRSQPSQGTSKEVYWNPSSGHIERVGLEGVDIVINLAGAPIADKRWTPRQKELLIQSRIQSTELLSKTLAKLKTPPKLFLSASAVGYYGTDDHKVFDESSPHGDDFLASLCVAWEEATRQAQEKGIQTIHLRSAPVLGTEGGVLKGMLPFFKTGLGAYIASGNQPISWISLADWIAAVEFLIFKSPTTGPVNLTSPNPVTNREFSETLAKVLKRPCKLNMPESLIVWRYGEMAKTMLVEGAKVQPKKLLEMGFEFEYPTLQKALAAILT
ncbi:MAG: TIGR01777 family oxidoreductase [Myxococcota bacterium]